MLNSYIIEIFYFISAIFVILGFRYLGKIKHAKFGNYLLSTGMGLGVLVTFLNIGSSNLGWIFSAIIIGTVMGILSARKIRMTSAPQIMALFNGFGGISAAIIAFVAFTKLGDTQSILFKNSKAVYILISSFFGTVSFSGSMLSVIKSRKLLPESGLTFPLQRILNFGTLIGIFSLSFFILAKSESDIYLFYLHIFLSIIYGVFFFLPINGIDSPISISFLNSYSGISLAFSGLIYNNQLMLVCGVFVGFSGIILSYLQASSVNRSFFKILLGGTQSKITSPYYHLGVPAREISIPDASILLKYSKNILIIPGYGLGITQTQYFVKELDDLLTGFGVEVEYLVHPYGGRTPGHINILLAEANINYDKIKTVEEVNQNINHYDLVLCIGANDIINPYTDRDKKNPLFGIPKINLDMAKVVIVLKRSLQPGFAGIENHLFFQKNTQIILGNLKSVLLKLIVTVREV